jgi:hypothetical protein
MFAQPNMCSHLYPSLEMTIFTRNAPKQATRSSGFREELTTATMDCPPTAPKRQLADGMYFEKKRSYFKRMTKCVGRLVAKCKAKYRTSLNEKYMQPSESQEGLLNWKPDQELLVCPISSPTGSDLNAQADETLPERVVVKGGPARVAQRINTLHVEPSLASMSARGGMISAAEFLAFPTYSGTSTSRGEYENEIGDEYEGEGRENDEIGFAVSFDEETEYLNRCITMIIQQDRDQSQIAENHTGEGPVDQSLFADFDSSNFVTDSEDSENSLESFYPRSSAPATDSSLTGLSENGETIEMLYPLNLQLWIHDSGDYRLPHRYTALRNEAADEEVDIAFNELDNESDMEMDFTNHTMAVHTQECPYDWFRK